MLARFIAQSGGVVSEHHLGPVPIGQLGGAAGRVSSPGQHDLALGIEQPAVRIGGAIEVGVITANRAQRIVSAGKSRIEPAPDQYFVLGLDDQTAVGRVDTHSLACPAETSAAKLPTRTQQICRATLQPQTVTGNNCRHVPTPSPNPTTPRRCGTEN